MKPEECKTFEDAVDCIQLRLKELLISKHKDYGRGNIQAFGEYGVLVRATDKILRLQNLLKPSGDESIPFNESVEDTWRDLANYAIIALMLRANLFELPLDESDT